MEPLARYRLSKIPPIISHWLGYRSSPPKPPPFHIVIIWSFIGAFCGLVVIQATLRAHYFTRRAVPSVIASYGASAVLIYGSIDSPLAQPRQLVGGHFIGALIGICISHLFRLLPPNDYANLQWLGGSLSVSFAIVAMQYTKTVHPPAGATALLAVTSPQVVGLSWYLLPVVLLSSAIALVWALFVNNIQRRYPLYWFTDDLPPPSPTDQEAGESDSFDDGSTNGDLKSTPQKHSSVSPLDLFLSLEQKVLTHGSANQTVMTLDH